MHIKMFLYIIWLIFFTPLSPLMRFSQILQVMAEDSDDGFNPEVMKLGKKNEMEKLRMGVDSSEEVINEFKFLTQEEVN